MRTTIVTLAFLLVMFFTVSAVSADVVMTELGKIVYTQGHYASPCRVVSFKENDSGVVKNFRIRDTDSDDNVAAVILSALMANRDVRIYYDPDVTTGCGQEPAIAIVTVY